MMTNYIRKFLSDSLSFCKQTLNHYQNNPWGNLLFFTKFLGSFIIAEVMGHPWIMAHLPSVICL